MQFVPDKSHLRDHFYDTADKMDIDKDERPEWVGPKMARISKGETNGIIEELVIENDKKESDRLRRLIGYLNRFSGCLDYDSFKEKGYPIGSGEVESSHKGCNSISLEELPVSVNQTKKICSLSQKALPASVCS